MLGRSMIVALSGNGAAAPVCLAPTEADLDITNEIAVWKYIKQVRPASIINCAALTNVDACEAEVDTAYRVNGRAVGFMAHAAKRFHAKFIQVSSDYVLDGEESLYDETAKPNPLQVYGKSKLLGEDLALEHGGIIARVQWLFGRHKQNFVSWVVGNIQQNKAMQVSTTQIGCSTSTDWLARTLLMMGSHPGIRGGIYNVAHDDYGTRFDCASLIARTLGISNPDQFLVPVETATFGVAKRPIKVCLNVSRLKKDLGLPTLGSWKQDVAAFVTNNWQMR